MFLNLRALVLAAGIAASIAETAFVHPKDPGTEGVGDVHVMGDSDEGNQLCTVRGAASPRFVRRDLSDMAGQAQARTDRRLPRSKSRRSVPEAPGISKSCRRQADLTHALAAAYDLVLRARDNTKTELWAQ